MSVSIQQENVFQQLSHPFAEKHRGLDQGGGATGWGLEDSDKGEIEIFHLKQVLFFFAFSSSSSPPPPLFFCPLSPCKRYYHQRGVKKTQIDCEDSFIWGSPWRQLSLGVMLVFFCIRGDGCLPVTSLEKYCLALRWLWNVRQRDRSWQNMDRSWQNRETETFLWSFLGPWCPNLIKMEGACHQSGVRPAPKHLWSGAAKQ